jgi:CheY-like chemotaxis protein
MKERIRTLIVDDDEDLRELLGLGLSEEGFDVDTARDGLDALEKLRVRRCDVLLVDLRMPRMNGLELMDALKREPSLAEIPVVVITGDTVQGQDALASGAAALLRKPFDVGDAVAAILEHAPRRRRRAA